MLPAPAGPGRGVCSGGKPWGGVHFAGMPGRVATLETTVSRDAAVLGGWRCCLTPSGDARVLSSLRGAPKAP